MNRSRREFLAQVGQGMLMASVGSALALDMGLASPALAKDRSTGRLTFGNMEPLVALMEQTPADKLLPMVVAKLQSGTELRTVVAAAALANARCFGGHDYDGYHTFMALTPSYQMAQELPESRRALPVLKVLHRNARFIAKIGAAEHEALHPLESPDSPSDNARPSVLRDATRQADLPKAERALAALTRDSLDDAYRQLQQCIQDDTDVHRVVLSWRAWSTLDLTGKEQALTLLRQSVRYCVDAERWRISHNRAESGVRKTLPQLMDQYHLLGRKPGVRRADDLWVDNLCQTIYAGSPTQAAEAVAAALAEGIAPADIGEAISLAANRLLLRDPGRSRAENQKPIGSVHGASVGVHASDAANAWRNIARVSDDRNTMASLIVAGYHTAGQAGYAGQKPYPWPEHLEAVKVTDADALLAELAAAIEAKDQVRACAVAQRYGERGHGARPIFDLLLKYAISEDGALHAEKYYRTVAEEFTTTRPAFRWRQVVALARVTASEYGFSAPGYAEARQLLHV
jgi:hypothetical protein